MDEYQIQNLLDKLFCLSSIEKNNLYHFLVKTIKNNNANQAAGLIVAQFGELLSNKRMEIEETSEEKKAGKVSPIFRRVS